jgi:hypothetical protein
MNETNYKIIQDCQRERSFLLSTTKEALETVVTAINTMLKNKWLVPAATVECELTNFFHVTNSINSAWTDNDGVTVIQENDGFMSSSSIGDIFVDENDRCYLVGPHDMILLKGSVQLGLIAPEINGGGI